MKKLLFLAISLISLQFAIAQGWNANLVSSTENEIIVELKVDGYISNNVVTPNGDAVVITNKKMMPLAQAGEPNVPSVVIPVIVGDNALMDVEIIDAQYVDYQNVKIAPSKGDFPRSINPEDVPYTYGAMYQQDAFYPTQIARLNEPYIHRDVRGQNIVVTPYLYNPVTKTLRVYNHIVVRMKNIGVDDRNVLVNRSNSTTLSYEFDKMYENRYINYQVAMGRYTAAAEDGELLIICHDAFMTAMAPFVAWKKQIGRQTTMVGTSTTGATEAAIKQYIQTYYASHPNLTDILLVGDVAQIPGVYTQAGSGYSNNYSGYGDIPYGQLAGNDLYNEVLVGRFCCETEAQVTNHVNKVLNYERDLDQTATWLSEGQGISTTAGNSGHYNEDDYQHIDNIRTDLLGYGYTNVYRDYQYVNGSTASNANAVSQHINSGVSIINYCNHGSETGWGVFNYGKSQVNALTNDYKLPYIISTACLVGKYDYSSGCFAEAWMRATNNSNGNPTGAIGGMFSYISQPWVPPMYGQDEMVDVLVESYNNNIKRTMGGVSINGNMKVLDMSTSNPYKGTYNNWILYGDPTLTLRTATPAVMNVTAASSMTTSATSFSVTATNANGARATLTCNGEIMGSAIISNGSANITFTAPGTTGTATLTVFGYNKKTYVATVNITGGTPTPVTLTVTASSPVIADGSSTRLLATATGGNGTFTYSWTPAESLSNANVANPTATPTTTTTYTCTATSAGYSDTKSCTVEVVTAPTNLTAQDINYNNIMLNWDAAALVDTYSVFVNNFELYTGITESSYIIQEVQPGTYTLNVVAHYSGVASPKSNSVTVTIEEPTPLECPEPENFNGVYYYNEDCEFGVLLSWDDAEYEAALDRYEIYRSTNGVRYELVKSLVCVPSISHYETVDYLEETGNFFYRIIAFYKNDCESMPSDIAVYVTSAAENWADDAALYPNPTSGMVNIKAEGLKQIAVVNVTGQVVMSQNVDTDEIMLDMSAFDNGMYLVSIITERGKVVKVLNVLR